MTPIFSTRESGAYLLIAAICLWLSDCPGLAALAMLFGGALGLFGD